MLRHIQATQTCVTELGFLSTVQIQKIHLYPIFKIQNIKMPSSVLITSSMLKRTTI